LSSVSDERPEKRYQFFPDDMDHCYSRPDSSPPAFEDFGLSEHFDDLPFDLPCLTDDDLSILYHEPDDCQTDVLGSLPEDCHANVLDLPYPDWEDISPRLIDLETLEDCAFFKFIVLKDKQRTAVPLAVAHLVHSGGTTLFVGDGEEIFIWKHHVDSWRGPRNAKARIFFAETHQKSKPIELQGDGILYDRVVGSKRQDVFRAKRTYYCSLMFIDRAPRHPDDMSQSLYMDVVGGPVLEPVSVEETVLKFAPRICGSRFEQDFQLDCPICGKTARTDVVETTCCRSLCAPCFKKIKKFQCPFCMGPFILAKSVVNPSTPTAQELVEKLLATRDPTEWIVLGRCHAKTTYNPILARFDPGPRRTASKHFQATHRHDLSSVKGLIFEKGWCAPRCIERVLEMMAGPKARTIQKICLRAGPKTM